MSEAGLRTQQEVGGTFVGRRQFDSFITLQPLYVHIECRSKPSVVEADSLSNLPKAG